MYKDFAPNDEYVVMIEEVYFEIHSIIKNNLIFDKYESQRLMKEIVYINEVINETY